MYKFSLGVLGPGFEEVWQVFCNVSTLNSNILIYLKVNELTTSNQWIRLEI